MRSLPDCIARLQAAGISYDDAIQLRRVSMTLHRWHELECGDGNNYGSWAIERIPVTKQRLVKRSSPSTHPQYDMTIPAGTECKFVEGNGGGWVVSDTSKVKGGNAHDLATRYIFLQADEIDELPFLVHHHYQHGKGKDYTTRTKIADRENGAKRRLARILAKYSGLSAYIQTDPRGCALYVLRPGDVREGQDPSACYTNGIAVYK